MSPPVVTGKELVSSTPGALVRVYADTKQLGLPVPASQSVVLREVSFLPATEEHPASVIGVIDRAGNWLKGRHTTGVVFHEDLGALAVRLNDEWRIGWRVAGWHPGTRTWCALDNGAMRPMHYSPWAVAVGRHLFVGPRTEGKGHRRKPCV